MRKNQLNNRPALLETRRALRRALTPAEATLWRALKGGQVAGWKFRRQHSVGPFVLDFYCPAARVAVELDGAGHFSAPGMAADVERDGYIRQQHIEVLRVENRDVFSSLESILAAIDATCQRRSGTQFT